MFNPITRFSILFQTVTFSHSFITLIIYKEVLLLFDITSITNLLHEFNLIAIKSIVGNMDGPNI